MYSRRNSFFFLLNFHRWSNPVWLSVVWRELLYFMYQYHRRHRRSEFLKPMSIENRRHRQSEFLKPMSIENLILAFFFLNSCQVDILKLFVCGSTYLFNLNESIPISKARNISNKFFCLVRLVLLTGGS